MELSARTSGHQTEFIGQIPSNAVLASISKHLSPPTKARDIPPIRKIISHCKNIKTKIDSISSFNSLDIRLHGRRNDISIADDLLDSHSIMSADSIEPSDILKQSQIVHPYSPIKTSLNQWNTPKTPLLESDGKDFLTVSSMTTRKQEVINPCESFVRIR